MEKEEKKGVFSFLSDTFENWKTKRLKAQELGIVQIEAAMTQEHSSAKSKKMDGVLNSIMQKNLLRNVVQIAEWRQGLEAWEDIRNPDRSWLHEVYQEVILDPQVAAKVGVAHHKIEASEFVFTNPTSGDEDLDMTEKFKSEWFSKFLRESLNADYYGHTLFQFPSSHEDFVFDANNLIVIPRWLVLPKGTEANGYQGVVLPAPGAQDGVKIHTGRASQRLLPIGDPSAFGMFAAIAPLFIYKKNALSFWSGYQQRYGEPTIAIKMDTQDDASHKNYQNFLRNRATNSGLILRQEDDAQLLEAYRNDASALYKEMVTYADDGINKALEGQTGTSESGGSKSTGDVHADVAKIYHLGRLKKLAFAVNDHLMPFLVEQYGFDFGDKVFRWREFKDVDAEVENMTKLAANFDISNDEVKARTGYIVEGMKQPEAVDNRQTNRKTGNDPDDNTAKKRTS
jgi:hypothetical protein